MEQWAELDDDKCACHGCGWVETSQDKWMECPIHFNGQIHPNSKALLLDEPDRLADETRKSYLRYQIRESQNKIDDAQSALQREQQKLKQLELELINRTPTVKSMKAVIPPLPVPSEPKPFELNESDFL